MNKGREKKVKRKATLLQSWLCLPLDAKKEPPEEEFEVLVCSWCYSFWAVVMAELVPAADNLSRELSVRKDWCGEHGLAVFELVGRWPCIYKAVLCAAPVFVQFAIYHQQFP